MNFRNYRSSNIPVRCLVLNYTDHLCVSARDWDGICAMLAPLGAKREGGEFHRDHCYRVGLLCAEIAIALNNHAHNTIPVRACFFAGLLHDVGKALVPMCTLCATEKWTDEDRRNMEPHVIDGFRMLRDRFDFSAHVIARHHKTQSGGYPAEIPKHDWSADTEKKISECAKILTVADVFDAMHRVNSATGGTALTDEQIKEKMLKIDPMVELLYERDVLR